jgi:hypothetical protein
MPNTKKQYVVPTPKFHLGALLMHKVGLCGAMCRYCDYNFHHRRSLRPSGNPEKLSFIFSVPDEAGRRTMGHVHGIDTEIRWECAKNSDTSYSLKVFDSHGAHIETVMIAGNFDSKEQLQYPWIPRKYGVSQPTLDLEREEPKLELTDVEKLLNCGFEVRATKYSNIFQVLTFETDGVLLSGTSLSQIGAVISGRGPILYAGIGTASELFRTFTGEYPKWVARDCNHAAITLDEGTGKKYLKNLAECSEWLKVN